MKKPYILLGLVALLSLASCQKEKLTGSSFTATIEKYTDRNTKTVLDGAALKWEANDRIIVLNDRTWFGIYATQTGGTTSATFTFVPNASNSSLDIDVGDPNSYNEDYPEPSYYMAIYPPEIVNLTSQCVTLPRTQQTTDGNLHGFPMYAQSTTKQLNFKNVFGLVKLSLEEPGVNITSITITTDQIINGNFTIDNNATWDFGDVPPLIYANDGSGSNSVTLQCGTGSGISINSGADFYIYLPAGSYGNLSISLTTSDGGFCYLTADAEVTIPIERSKYTTVQLGPNDLDFVNINGLFSVSPSQYVEFSLGNLQYKPSTGAWRFASTQLEMLGEENYNYFVYGTNNADGWIDLFSWGEETPTRNIADYNADGYTTFYEWGENIGTGNDWFTLSAEQWLYLIGGRPNASSLYGGATIADVQGLILLPDSWSQPSGINFNPGFAYSNFYSRNIYTAEQALVMQAAGAVFLPAAGAVMGTIITREGQQLLEWYYSYTFPDFENWDDYSGWEGLGPAIAHGLYLIVRDANVYWTATPYSGEVIVADGTNQAYSAVFSTVPGVTQDPTGGDIYGFQDDIWWLHPEIEGNTQRIELFSIFNNPDFYFTRGEYVFGVPLPTFAKGAVRLVRNATPSTTSGDSRKK